jgi:hypothetical protein
VGERDNPSMSGDLNLDQFFAEVAADTRSSNRARSSPSEHRLDQPRRTESIARARATRAH